MGVFSESLLRLRQDIDQSHENRRKLIRDIQSEVREMAEQNGSRLAEQGRQRQTQFASMIKELPTTSSAVAGVTSCVKIGTFGEATPATTNSE